MNFQFRRKRHTWFFSKFRIQNCIIISREHFKIHKEYGRPINVNDIGISLLGRWDISAQGHFTKNTDMFPGKISNTIKCCLTKGFVRQTFRILLRKLFTTRIHMLVLESSFCKISRWLFSCPYTRRFRSGGRICRDKFNFGYVWKANLYCLKWSGNTLFCGLRFWLRYFLLLHECPQLNTVYFHIYKMEQHL